MSSQSTKEHKEGTEKAYSFYLITVSSSRFSEFGAVTLPEEANDGSGKLMKELVTTAGHKVTKYELIPDDPSLIKGAIHRALESDADVVITSGGTGLASKDVTIESVAPLFDKDIPGFGELFRFKSIEQIGSSVILSRAAAGLLRGKVVFCIPGSPNAVELALRDIILPETGHLVKHARQ
nr:MogA/MoaB family molybdenum cofactor biosynthesis protein [uncultured Methanolobus sp.]